MSDTRRYAVWPWYDLIQGQGQGQGHGGPKAAKMADFKVYLLRRYAITRKPS